MNLCVHAGRATKKATANYTQGNNPMCISRFTLAVDRRFKKDGQSTADFINFVAFGKTGEFCEKYVDKGVKFMVTSHVQTGSYEKDGQKVFTTDFVVDNIEFCESKAAQQQAGPQSTPQTNSMPTMSDYTNIPEGVEEQMPFS